MGQWLPQESRRAIADGLSATLIHPAFIVSGHPAMRGPNETGSTCCIPPQAGRVRQAFVALDSSPDRGFGVTGTDQRQNTSRRIPAIHADGQLVGQRLASYLHTLVPMVDAS